MVLCQKWLGSFLVTSYIGNSRVKKQLNLNLPVVFRALFSCLPGLNKSVCWGINGLYWSKTILRNLFFTYAYFIFRTNLNYINVVNYTLILWFPSQEHPASATAHPSNGRLELRLTKNELISYAVEYEIRSKHTTQYRKNIIPTFKWRRAW